MLNVIKAKYRLRDKSAAIDRMAEEYGDEHLEVRPEYWAKLKRISKQKKIKIGGAKQITEYFESMRR